MFHNVAQAPIISGSTQGRYDDMHPESIQEWVVRRIVLYELMSLDGVAEEPGNWMCEVDDAVVGNLAAIIARQDAVLLGRRTYDYWSGYWPTSDVQPFADFINGTTKHVFTSTEPPDVWAHSVFVDEPMVEYVRQLRSVTGGDIGVHGSITLAQGLLEADLVDELALVVAPALAAGGRKLFEARHELRRLELRDVDRATTGAVFLHYARTR